jgi:TolA-binding protein
MSSHRSKLLTAVLVAAAAFSSRAARADEACVPPAVTAALSDCSTAASLPSVSAAALAQARTAPPAPAASLPGARAKKAPRNALDPRPFDVAEQGLAAAHQRFACEHKAPAADPAARDQQAEVAFQRARLYFDARHFQEAAALLRELALGGAETPSGKYAVQLYLESLNVLASRGAEACYGDMARDVPTFAGLYCKSGQEKADAETCEILGRLQRDIHRLEAEQLIRAAERADRGPSATYEAAAERYMAIWNEQGRAPCEAKKAGCERMEEILYNAARAYQAARAIDKSIATRKLLIDPRYNLQNTELARRAVYEIGGMHHALAQYEEAATWYERYAAESPKAEKAPEALQDAVVLRLGLGQEEQAVKDAELFVKSYASAKPAQAALIAFAISAHDVEKEKWAEARKRLTGAMSQIDRDATLDVQIQAHALLGRVLAKLGKAADAGSEYDKVRALWKDPGATVHKIQIQTNDDVRRLGKALVALGEARFFLAEEKRRAAEAIRLPAYTGSGKRADIAEFAAQKLAPALAARRKAVDDAEKVYLAVLDIQPIPPPRWVIAAAARVAQMHGRLAAELRALPAPKGWKQQGTSPWGARWEDVRAAWTEALDAAGEPERAKAKAANRKCLDLSVKFQYFDAFARSCATWLERHYPNEHPRFDEIVPRPTNVAFGLVSRPPPEPK